jgi:hypothetical protein
MQEKTPLGERILKHWQTHHPQMVAQLRKEHQLEQTLHEVEERTADLLYELTCVKKMDYQAAWETAMAEWAFPSNEDRPSQPSSGTSNHRRKKHLPATSG